MLLAYTEKGDPIEAEKGLIGFCNICGTKLIPRCGEIKVWHWAHKSNNCDSWSENESWWHYDWKMRFGKENCEKVLENHRADVCIENKGAIVEIQKSYLNLDDIRERQSFYSKYGTLFWVFNSEKFSSNFIISYPSIREKKYESNSAAFDVLNFRWRKAKQNILYAKNAYIDLGKHLFKILEHETEELYYEEFDSYYNGQTTGYGLLIEKTRFVNYILNYNKQSEIIVSKIDNKTEIEYDPLIFYTDKEIKEMLKGDNITKY